MEKDMKQAATKQDVKELRLELRRFGGEVMKLLIRADSRADRIEASLNAKFSQVMEMLDESISATRAP